MVPHDDAEQPLPLRLHTTTAAPGPLAENWIWARGFTCGEAGDIVSAEPETIVTIAEPEADESADEVAVTVTVAGVGTFVGAAYSPEAESAPQVAPLHPLPDNLQVTVVFVVPVTTAENCCCAPVATCADAGFTNTDTAAAAWIRTVAVPDWVGSAFEVATMVAVAGVGTVAGAVYKPDDVMVPQAPERHPVPVTDHVTAVFVVPVTRAVNCWVVLTANVTEDGVTETATVDPPMVTVAVPVCVGSKIDVAATVTAEGLGALVGAAYSPSAVIVPHVIPLQPAPDNDQTTMPPDALNCTEPPGLT